MCILQKLMPSYRIPREEDLTASFGITQVVLEEVIAHICMKKPHTVFMELNADKGENVLIFMKSLQLTSLF